MLENHEGKPFKIVQHIHPYADGGPMAFTPRQTMFGGPIGPMWDRRTDVMLLNLIAYGLPDEPPASSNATEATGNSRAATTPWILPAVLAGLLLVAAIGGQSRAQRLLSALPPPSPHEKA